VAVPAQQKLRAQALKLNAEIKALQASLQKNWTLANELNTRLDVASHYNGIAKDVVANRVAAAGVQVREANRHLDELKARPVVSAVGENSSDSQLSATRALLDSLQAPLAKFTEAVGTANTQLDEVSLVTQAISRSEQLQTDLRDANAPDLVRTQVAQLGEQINASATAGDLPKLRGLLTAITSVISPQGQSDLVRSEADLLVKRLREVSGASILTDEAQRLLQELDAAAKKNEVKLAYAKLLSIRTLTQGTEKAYEYRMATKDGQAQVVRVPPQEPQGEPRYFLVVDVVDPKGKPTPVDACGSSSTKPRASKRNYVLWLANKKRTRRSPHLTTPRPYLWSRPWLIQRWRRWQHNQACGYYTHARSFAPNYLWTT
jgi:hypothetical protein